MKIAVASDGEDLNSEVASKFGRCNYFLFVNTEAMEFVCKENTYKEGASGVGVSVSQFLSDNEVDAVLSGNIGPKALDVLDKANIGAYKAQGLVEGAIKDFQNSSLEKLEEATRPQNSGKNF